MRAPTPLSAYTEGIDHALTALAYLGGILTVLALTGCAGISLTAASRPLYDAVRLRWKSRALHREARASGRS